MAYSPALFLISMFKMFSIILIQSVACTLEESNEGIKLTSLFKTDIA